MTSKLLPTIYENFKPLFSVKYNTHRIGKGPDNFILMTAMAEKHHNIFYYLILHPRMKKIWKHKRKPEVGERGERD